ncbi:unnamed protein product [Cylicocyclus nassatus]|uniref:Uncharacterized protein n=1 Tax=Cylicocyclus nassatus TaxID=53992 RepID=A0AA36GQ48_CYLNA|nr:unnamed protein product [Cylicocyclus nassatus]
MRGVVLLSGFSLFFAFGYCNQDAKRLYDDLINNYNRHKRPASGPHKPATIKLQLRLSQIIDVHEINQIMTCSVWLKQVWMDKRLSWDPKKYGGVGVLYVPYEMIWVPDIVLYNNADSYYNITISTKATLHYSGQVTWEPPAIFKSLCQIDVRWFPFDEQECYLKFGSWTYSEDLINLELLDDNVHYEQEVDENGVAYNITVADDGIDLSDYYPSVEWDIMSRVGIRRSKNYPSCCNDSPYVDVTYYLNLRRKPLFYTVNLVFPCVGISFLTIAVFYLPSYSGEKVSMCISIVVALTMFILLLTEIIPATSITLPLIGKYLLFTMVMVTLSVFVTVASLDVHFRTPKTHSMPKWVKVVFLNWLPKILFMRRVEDRNNSKKATLDKNYELTSLEGKIPLNYHVHRFSNDAPVDERIQKLYKSPQVTELLKSNERDDKVDEDWNFVAMVLDRLFLFIFAGACFSGTMMILLQAPTLYDYRKPIDLQYRPANLSGIF